MKAPVPEAFSANDRPLSPPEGFGYAFRAKLQKRVGVRLPWPSSLLNDPHIAGLPRNVWEVQSLSALSPPTVRRGRPTTRK